MESSSHSDESPRHAKIGIKDEYDQKPYVSYPLLPALTNCSRLENIPIQSTIAQFIRSGQAAFGSVGPQLLECNDVSGEVQNWMLGRVRERLSGASDLYHDDVLILRPLLQLEYSAGPGSSNTTGLCYLLPELLRLMKSNLTYTVTFTSHVLEFSNNEVPQSIKEDLLRAVAQVLDAVSLDMRDQRNIECQLAAFGGTKRGEFSGPRPLEKYSAAALGIFTKRFYSVGLYKPVESMLQRFQLEMVHAHSLDLHTIYVPFLQELIGLMLVYGIPMTNVVYSAFFETVLQQYFERFVGLQANQKTSVEQKSWRDRGIAARVALERFDHSYFRDILGDRYDSGVLSAMMNLP